jgi:hypothetical protein
VHRSAPDDIADRVNGNAKDMHILVQGHEIFGEQNPIACVALDDGADGPHVTGAGPTDRHPGAGHGGKG